MELRWLITEEKVGNSLDILRIVVENEKHGPVFSQRINQGNYSFPECRLFNNLTFSVLVVLEGLFELGQGIRTRVTHISEVGYILPIGIKFCLFDD